jgi:ring-1,2-phenylacetyl-CoA epoxidase subunit PaaD
MSARAAVFAVCDPELGDVTIGELGMVVAVCVSDEIAGDNGVPIVLVELMPTFLGCPARSVIERSVREALAPTEVVIKWVSKVWTEALVSDVGRTKLGLLGIAVGDAPCPNCGGADLVMLGPSATSCRSAARCNSCHEVIEVLRSAASPVRFRGLYANV